MSNLFKKINTLVRARIEGFIDEDLRLPTRGSRQDEQPSVEPLSKETSREIVTLRQRIDDAIGYEEELQNRIDALHQDASDLDLRADDALRENDEQVARQAALELRQTEQQIKQMEEALARHRADTSALMDRVNLLEGMIADAHAGQQDQGRVAAPPPVPEQPDTAQEVQEVKVRVTVQSDETAGDLGAYQPEQDADRAQSMPDDDNLAARRARLSRRTPDTEE